MKNLKPNNVNVKNTMIFNNVFYDITQFDIQSNNSKQKPLMSQNKSCSNNRSQEKNPSLNVSIERS